MARQKDIYLTGRWGNIVGSSRYGKGYLRYQPNHIKQTSATIESSKMMGIASAMGAAFRREWKHVIPFTLPRVDENRFTGALKKWLQTQPFEGTHPANELPYITAFDFNEKDTLEQRVHVPLHLARVDHAGLELHIPALVPKQQVGAPAYTDLVTWTIAATCYHPASKSITGTYTTMFNMPYDNNHLPAQVIPLPVEMSAGTITLVLVSLRYRVKRKGVSVLTDEMRWLPCGIIGGWVENG
jgi:hypothetical protein